MKILKLLFFIIVLFEFSSGYAYFQKSWEKGIASVWLIKRIINKINTEKENLVPTIVSEEKYQLDFYNFVKKAKSHRIKILMLYIPQAPNFQSSHKDFFKSVAKSADIYFLDTTQVIEKHNTHYIYNLPNDPHLSRLGHQLIAQLLQDKLSSIKFKKFFPSANDKLNILKIEGPHPKNIDQLRLYSKRGFRVQTNNQGFRMVDPAIISKHTKTILILGDSFTYGIGVNTEDAYPNILNKNLINSLVINSGIPGAGLTEELIFFKIFIKSNYPDIVIVQVLDNDVFK